LNQPDVAQTLVSAAPRLISALRALVTYYVGQETGTWPSIAGPCAAAQRGGFFFVRQRGSHQRYRHADGRRVTVAPHAGGDTFSVKTLQKMIEGQACWTEADLKRLKLIR
jgi:predicted RNA binding protein YcfA (HicA-like mRNA interferase family)